MVNRATFTSTEGHFELIPCGSQFLYTDAQTIQGNSVIVCGFSVIYTFPGHCCSWPFDGEALGEGTITDTLQICPCTSIEIDINQAGAKFTIQEEAERTIAQF